MEDSVSTEARRDPNQGYTVAFWLLLGLALVALAGWLLAGLGSGRAALGVGELTGSSAWDFLDLAAMTGYLGAWLLGIILAASLHRWLWLAAIVLFPPSAVAFALICVAAGLGHRRAVSGAGPGQAAAGSPGGRS
jgi:hypothetical protein